MGVKKTSPEQGTLNVAKKATQTFIGKAWKNVTKNGKHVGTEYLNITLDRDIDEVVMKKGNRIMLWPNTKREGKQDADFRVSLIEA